MEANNMKEMREALGRLLKWVDEHTGIYSVRVSPVHDDPNVVRKEKSDVEAMSRAALAAPARNCDLYNDVEDAWQGYKKFCIQTGRDVYFDMTHFWSFAEWLLAPAAERKGETE